MIREVITMRSDAVGIGDALEFLAGLRSSEGFDIEIYRRIDVPGDLSVHIIHSPEEVPESGEIGRQVISELGRLGIIHHSLWTNR